MRFRLTRFITHPEIPTAVGAAAAKDSREAIMQLRARINVWVLACLAFGLAVTLSLSAGSRRTILQLFASAPTVEQCSGIPADAERLKCFDQAALSLRTSPAKGGIAPPLFEPTTTPR